MPGIGEGQSWHSTVGAVCLAIKRCRRRCHHVDVNRIGRAIGSNNRFSQNSRFRFDFRRSTSLYHELVIGQPMRTSFYSRDLSYKDWLRESVTLGVLQPNTTVVATTGGAALVFYHCDQLTVRRWKCVLPLPFFAARQKRCGSQYVRAEC